MSNERVEKAYELHAKSSPVNIEQMIRDSGLQLEKSAELQEGIAGELRKNQDDTYTVSVNSQDHYYRRRFTMAHELGHYYLHRSLIGDGVDDSVKYRSTVGGNFYNTNIAQKHEREANFFAAFVLMPEELLKESVDALSGQPIDTSVIREMAIKFQVSPEAMKIRLSSLRLL